MESEKNSNNQTQTCTTSKEEKCKNTCLTESKYSLIFMVLCLPLFWTCFLVLFLIVRIHFLY